MCHCIVVNWFVIVILVVNKYLLMLNDIVVYWLQIINDQLNIELFMCHCVVPTSQCNDSTPRTLSIFSMCGRCEQQAASGRMSVRLVAVETTQAEFRNQLSELMMTSHNNEQALKSCHKQLDNLATMVTSIMTKLESKTMMSPPTVSRANHDQTPRSPPKSTCETQAQSKPARVGACSANPIDVLDVSYVPSEDDNPPKQSVRITRSKDVKAKGVSGATGNSEVGTKAVRSEKASKKRKVTRGGGSKGRGAEEGNTQQVSAGDGTQGGDVTLGDGRENNPEGGSGVDGIGGSGDVEEGGKGVGVMGVVGKGDNGEAASGGVGGVHGGITPVQIGESDLNTICEVGVITEGSTPALSPERGASAFSIHVRSKTISPSKLGVHGGENNAPGAEVSPAIWPHSPSIPEPYNPTYLLIFNVHGTLLDTSLLSEPNPNPSIRITKKTTTRRFVFRPWMIEFLRRCLKFFKVAFWGQKSEGYMDEVLREILAVFEHMENHKPLFAWCAKDCEMIQKCNDVAIWGKPLTKVWKAWPTWNASNTIIVDHHAPRVECNPQVNVIVPPSFYVANMKDLSQDNDYLKVKLWPALGGLNTHQDVTRFWCALNDSGKHAGVCEVNTGLRSIVPRPPCIPFGDPRVPTCGGEGTCGLQVHIRHCPLTCNLLDE